MPDVYLPIVIPLPIFQTLSVTQSLSLYSILSSIRDSARQAGQYDDLVFLNVALLNLSTHYFHLTGKEIPA